MASLTFYLFSSTRLINSIKHDYSCKILYILITRFFSVTGNTLDIEFPETYVPDPSDPDSDPELPSDDEIEDDDEDD